MTKLIVGALGFFMLIEGLNRTALSDVAKILIVAIFAIYFAARG